MAFRDNTIVAAADYWVENNEFHYVTANGTEYTVPLNQIDLDLTTQLNSERGAQSVLRTAPNRP